MKLTNKLNLPAALVRAVANDDYDRQGSDITVTELIDPPRKVALFRRHWDQLEEDVSDRIWALLGQAVHEILRRSNTGEANMPLDVAIQLAVLAKDIPPTSIEQGAIGTDMVLFDNVVLGGQDARIMKPLPDKIRVLRDEIFTTSGAVAPLAPPENILMLREAAERFGRYPLADG